MRLNSRLGKMPAQEAMPEPRANTGIAGKKIPTDEGWDFGYWWSWRDLNPRPRALFVQFYMRSRLL